MTLDKKSKLVRWTYFLGYMIPRQTTLCRFFWRAFVFMPLFWLVGAGGAAGLAYSIYESQGLILVMAVAVLTGAAALVGVVSTLIRVLPMVRDSTFIQGIKAVKGKICPLVVIK